MGPAFHNLEAGRTRTRGSASAGGGRRRAGRQLDDQGRQAWIAPDAADVAPRAPLSSPIAAATLGFVRVLAPAPFGQAPIDEDLDVRISHELSLQIRVHFGMTTGHDEQITRHHSVLQAMIQGREGWRLEAL
ncbi:MAG TPA: hypothetical protein VLK35_08165 [Methylomirabilota bacterium]|nr:hypothetical protein [Methylomirabilota bacterium]